VFPSEVFILRRTGMEFWAKDSAGRKFKGKGELHVSTIRMVFVNHQGGQGFNAFDIPLASVTGEQFNQPIFGANNLSGVVQSITNGTAGVSGAVDFKLYFNEGGCTTFLQVFFKAIEQLRSIPTAVPVMSEFTQAAAAGSFVEAALVDPNDPSTVYVVQPEAQTAVPVAYPQNNLVASAVPVGTVVQSSSGQPAAAGVAVPVATAMPL